jgi:hypothetical protein
MRLLPNLQKCKLQARRTACFDNIADPFEIGQVVAPQFLFKSQKIFGGTFGCAIPPNLALQASYRIMARKQNFVTTH